jgi:hypothetical protein
MLFRQSVTICAPDHFPRCEVQPTLIDKGDKVPDGMYAVGEESYYWLNPFGRWSAKRRAAKLAPFCLQRANPYQVLDYLAASGSHPIQ